MGHYSIKDLEGFTGIKAHTLRIWEQRYNLLEPERTNTNIRLYDDKQLKVLLNAVMLYKNGYKISHIALLKESGVKEAVENIVKSNAKNSVLIDALVVCMINMDENSFEDLITNSIEKNGFETTVFEVIYPFFDRIGTLWLTDIINTAQEHFVSNLIRQKIIVAIDSLGIIKQKDAKVCLALLHEEEMHEIGLLLYSYFMKKQGVKVIYLGQIVPLDDALIAIATHQPDYILSSFVKPMESGWIDQYLKTLIQAAPKSTIISSGFQSSHITLQHKRLKIVENIDKLKATLKN